MLDAVVDEVLLEGNVIEGLSLGLLGEPVDPNAVVVSVGVGYVLLWVLCWLFGL